MKNTVSVLMVTLLVGTLIVAFGIQTSEAAGTIYARAKGSINPSTASITTSMDAHVPRLEFMGYKSLNSEVNYCVSEWMSGASVLRNDTKVRVGSDMGYWVITPSLLNTATTSPNLIGDSPLTTGGWIWEQSFSGPVKLNVEFDAGNWTFQLRLHATEAGVNATVWVRVLKSDNPDPLAPEAVTTEIKDWTTLFSSTSVPLSATIFKGNVSTSSTVFTDEYLLFEFQLQVTENLAESATTDVIFQIGGPTGDTKSQIWGPVFSYHDVHVWWLIASKALVGQGRSLSINVTAENEGDYPESFDVAIYANAIQVGSQLVTLNPREQVVLTYVWDTTGFAVGEYDIGAIADTVPREMDTADNACGSWFGSVFVTIPGDMNGDRNVNIFDIVSMTIYYGEPLPPGWPMPAADIDGDGDVDIFDIVIAAGNYGKSW